MHRKYWQKITLIPQKNRNSSSGNEYIDTLCQKVFVASVTRVLSASYERQNKIRNKCTHIAKNTWVKENQITFMFTQPSIR